MLQPSTSPEGLLDRAKCFSEEMAMHKQIARKEQKRKLSKLRYNKQREEILIRKSNIIKNIAKKSIKVTEYTVMKKLSNKKDTMKRTAIK